MKARTIILLAVLSLQSAWILATTVNHERSLTQGRIVQLETRPVDPRDLLRGDYVILNYKISDVPQSLFTTGTGEAATEGSTVYVALEQRGEFYEVAAASTQKMRPDANTVVLKGVVQRSWGVFPSNTVHIAYGLEQYFVHEGTGNVRGKFTVQAAVSESGRGQIKEVLVDGIPYREAARANAVGK